MTDVLLVSPPFRGLLREPIGLYYLAGVLNEAGISVNIMDFNVESPTRSEFVSRLRALKPRIVGVTSYTFNFSVARDIIEEIKRVDHTIITTMGGVHASAIPEKILQDTPALDYIVVGEGEQTFLELCSKIMRGEDISRVKGIAFRNEGRVTVNPPRELIEDLNELPFPDRELLPLKMYPVTLVQTTRGCPYNCIFCQINRFYGRRTRQRDPRRVVDEVDQLMGKYGIEKFFFFGDSFTFRQDWVEEFCEEIGKRGLKLQWACETRVDNVSLPLLRNMRKAGCREVQYGIDYGDEAVLKNLGKEISLGCIKDAVHWAKEAGLFTGGFFIFNVPGEDESTMDRTFDLIQDVPIDAMEVNLLTPYPGTPLWESPERYGMRIVNHNFDYYTTKKYVMENIAFPKKKFVPAFRALLKRLNFVVTPQNRPEIFDFLKKDIKPRPWREERRGLNGLFRL